MKTLWRENNKKKNKYWGCCLEYPIEITMVALMTNHQQNSNIHVISEWNNFLFFLLYKRNWIKKNKEKFLLNLCLSYFQAIEKIGPFVCAVKTHVDIIKDFNNDFPVMLTKLSEKHNFVIFEDRWVMIETDFWTCMIVLNR